MKKQSAVRQRRPIDGYLAGLAAVQSAPVYLPAGLPLLALYGYLTPGALRSESADLTAYMALFTAVVFFPQIVVMLWNYKKIALRFQAISMLPYLVIWLSAWLTNL